MKTLFSLGGITAILGLALASTFAQTQSTASSSTTYIQTSKLIGKKVKASQGDEIGVVKDVVLTLFFPLAEAAVRGSVEAAKWLQSRGLSIRRQAI